MARIRFFIAYIITWATVLGGPEMRQQGRPRGALPGWVIAYRKRPPMMLAIDAADMFICRVISRVSATPGERHCDSVAG
jgi:hypothetical protein